MANFYLAIQIQGDRNESNSAHDPDYGYYAYVLKVNENQNLVSELDAITGLVSANLCHTKKWAAELVNFWNARYKRNGTYLFDEPKF